MGKIEKFPDTIYLPDRVDLATNCLTRCLNPDKFWLPFCLIDLTGKPAKMRHSQFDYSDHTARVIDALFLAQALTGNTKGREELQALLELFRQGFDQDGLHYTPENPWSFRHANMHYQRSVLNALLSWYLIKGEKEPKDRLSALIRGLTEAAVKREDFWYFPSVERLPDGWPRGDWQILGWGVDPANTNGRLLFGLTRAYEALNDKKALDLVKNFARHVMYHSSAYQSDGNFATGIEFREGHFHSRAVTMLGIIRYGYCLNDSEAIEWGRHVYKKARMKGSTFGWFPERLVRSRAHGCETCAIVDMMESAIWLAKSGFSEYWEDAERFLRNQLLESQLTSTDWLQRDDNDIAAADEWETTKDVAERALGGFAGWSQPNDLVSKVMHEWDLYMCCCAQGVRGLFNAWNHAVTCVDDVVSVNFLINHYSDHATVQSWLPNHGKLRVKLRREASLSVRVPSWVDGGTLKVAVNGVEISPPSEFQRIITGPHPKDTVVEVRFSMPQRSEEETILDTNYTVKWRGNTVVGISPIGEHFPLYKRETFCKDEVPMVSKRVNKVSITL